MSSRARLQIKRYARSFLILIALAVAGITAGFYILLQQRLPNPFTHFVSYNAAFPTAVAVVPGLGEPVDVAGVHVGEITGTKLRNGLGIVQMQLDPSKGVAHLYRDAHAELIPNTPLKDMYVDINPGSRSAGVLPAGSTIPVAQTTSPTDSDELLDELDVDTRTWFTSLVTALADGTKGRGEDIRRLFLTLGPTAGQMRQIGDLLAQRRGEVALLVHNLGTLAHATSQDDNQLGQLVAGGDRAIGALASQNQQLQRSITLLPGTLARTRTTLGDLTGFSNQLAPTATALLPTARTLPSTLRRSRTLILATSLLPLNKIKAFENAVAPLAAQLPSVQAGLRTVVPELSNAFKVLHYVTNEIAYTSASNPGFLYWLAWFAHNADSFMDNSDANGSAWRTLTITSCAGLKSFSFGPLVEALLGTTFGCS